VTSNKFIFYNKFIIVSIPYSQPSAMTQTYITLELLIDYYDSSDGSPLKEARLENIGFSGTIYHTRKSDTAHFAFSRLTETLPRIPVEKGKDIRLAIGLFTDKTPQSFIIHGLLCGTLSSDFEFPSDGNDSTVIPIKMQSFTPMYSHKMEPLTLTFHVGIKKHARGGWVMTSLDGDISTIEWNALIKYLASSRAMMASVTKDDILTFY
jgi:hypothetical protein